MPFKKLLLSVTTSLKYLSRPLEHNYAHVHYFLKYLYASAPLCHINAETGRHSLAINQEMGIPRYNEFKNACLGGKKVRRGENKRARLTPSRSPWTVQAGVAAGPARQLEAKQWKKNISFNSIFFLQESTFVELTPCNPYETRNFKTVHVKHFLLTGNNVWLGIGVVW